MPLAHNLTGQRFGRLVALARSENRAGHATWLCKCDCGNTKSIVAYSLKAGTTKSCGCAWLNNEDITGERFGRLVALRRAPSKRLNRATKPMWLFRCDCGQEKVVALGEVRRGSTRSCGCFRAEFQRRPRTHGQTRTITYKSWKSINDRIFNSKHAHYYLYGGRGIELRYANYEAFIADVGQRPSKAYSIERIDNNGHYEPGNCRWATRYEQGSNMRTNRLLTHAGRTQTLAAWTRELGVAKNTLHKRLSLGWSVEKTLTTPKRVYP